MSRSKTVTPSLMDCKEITVCITETGRIDESEGAVVETNAAE
jgi:hypothetical protein